MRELIRVDNRLFVGRVEEQKQFRAALEEVLDPPPQEELPYVCIVSGDGGMGKTTLIKRFRDIALKEEPFVGEFQLLWIDWEDERKKFPSLRVGRNQISEETVFKTIHVAASRQKWGRQFAAYRKALQQREVASKRVAEVLAGDKLWDEAGMVRSLGVDALAKLVRMNVPVIGDAGEELVETFLEAGIEVGSDQAMKVRTGVENHLRAALNTHDFNYFLNPQEQLALAVARGLNRVAKRQPLIVVLDSYELIDRVDIWMRVVVREAGPRVLWVISDRHDLLHSRQFGREYFKGYADDFPRRLLGYQMRPLAIPHIRTYFEARVPDRPLSPEETEAISRVTRGIPLAVREAAEIWEAGTPLNEVIGDITVSTPGSQIVQKMTDRYLQHVVLETDRQALFALALAGGDVEVLRAMLQPPGEDEPPLDLEELLRRLERDYASVHAAHARLHDDPALFFLEYLKEPLRRTSKRVRRLNKRALIVLRQRLAELEDELSPLDERCRDDNWVQVVLSLTHYLFWLDEKAAWQWLIPRFVEGMAYNRDLQNGLIHVADEWKGHLTENGEQFLRVLRAGDRQERKLLQVLQQLEQRGWLAGDDESERKAILHLRGAAHLYREGHIEEALVRYRQVEESLDEGQQVLRQQLAVAYENLARRSLAKELEPALPPAVVGPLLQRAVTWAPEQERAWYLLGLIHEATGATAEAATAFQRAMELADPDDTQYAAAAQRLGDLNRKLGQLDEAHAAYETVLEVIPGASDAHAGLGAIYKARGEAGKARAAYEAAVAETSLEEANLEAVVGLAQIHLRERRDEEALNLFQKVLARAPQHAVASRGLGEAAYRLGQMEIARSYLREAAMLNPEDAGAHCSLARVYHRGLGQHQAAQVAYERALAVADDTTPEAVRVEAHVGLGDILRDAHRHQLALTAYQRALQLDSEAVAAHEGLARVYRALGRYEEALTAHQTAVAAAVQHAPDYPFAYDNLGAVYLALGHYREAASAFEDALALDETGARVYVGLGDARLALGEVEAAEEAYRQALALPPRADDVHGAALRGLGNVLLAQGLLDDALAAYEEALALAPDEAETYLRLAEARARQEYGGDEGDPEELYRQAVALNPTDARPLAGLGDLYFRRRQPVAAWTAYQKALALDPTLTAAYVGLGTLLSRAERDDEALAAYRQALEVEGGDGVLPQAKSAARAGAHRGLGDLYQRQARRSQGEEAGAAWQQALAAYRQATEIAPEDGRAFVGLGKVYQALGQEAEADAVYRQALAISTLEDAVAAVAHYGLGRIQQASEQHEQAVAAFAEAARLRPGWSAPRLSLGLLHARQGRPEQAVAALEEALAEVSEPGPVGNELAAAVPFMVLGEQHMLLDRFAEAARAFRRALAGRSGALHPARQARAYLGLGEAARNLGELAEAETAYRRAVARAELLSAEEQVRAHLGLAALLLDGARYPEAESATRQALALSPDNGGTARTYHLLGVALAGQRNYAEAAAAYRQGLEQDSRPASAAKLYHDLARAEHALGHHNEALSAYLQGQAQLEGAPPDALLGAIYVALGQEEAAETAFEDALASNPRDDAALNGLGTLYHQRGEQEQALPYFQRAVRLRPRTATPYVGLGYVHTALGKEDLAAAAFRSALQAPEATDDDRAAAHNGLGALHMTGGTYRRAARAYQRALSIAAGGSAEFTAAAGLGAACLALESWEEAAEAYQQAVNVSRDDAQTATALAGLAGAQAARGRLEVAATAYERALALQPEDAETHYQLAQVYASLDRHAEALRAYERSLALAPELAGTRIQLHLYRGRSALALGHLPQALQAYEEALLVAAGQENDDTQTPLYLFGGDLWCALERYDRALAAYEKARSLAAEEDQSAQVRAVVGVGHAHRALGAQQKAIAAYRQALVLEHRCAEAHAGLGATFADLGDPAAAGRAYEKALSLTAKDAPVRAEYYVGLAAACLQLDEIAAARTAYERALAVDPQLVVAYAGLGQILQQQGEPERALTCFRRVVELDPQRAAGHEAAGRVYLDLERYSEAEAAFTEALALAPESGTAQEGLGRALQGLKRPLAAMAAFEQAHALGLDHAALYQALGTLYAKQRRPQEALAMLEEALERGGVEAEIYAQMGFVYETLGDDDHAFSAYQQALALDVELALIHCGLGNIYRRRDHNYDALVAYRRALEIAPNYADAFYGMAQVYNQMGRAGDGMAAAERAVELAPEPGPILLYLADLYRRQGNLEAALEAYTQLLLEEEDGTRLTAAEKAAGHSGRAAVFVEQGEWQEAQRAFQQALAVEPDHAAAVAGLGDVHAAAGRRQEAMDAYQRALELDPDRSRTYTSLGNLYVQQGAAEEALDAYQQATTLDPRNPSAHTGLGDAYRFLGRADEALAAYEQAIRLNARLAGPHLGQGHLYRTLGRPYDALKSYQRAVKLEPLLPAYMGLGELYLEWGHLKDARTAYEEAVTLAPQNAAAYLGLADVHRDEGRYEEAIAVYERARQCPADDDLLATIHANLADAYNTIGRLEDAVAAYRQAVELKPDDALSHGSLAGLYRKLNRRDAYAGALAKARALMAEETEYNRACLEAIAGEVERAVELLEVALQQRQVNPGWVHQDPDFDFIRKHPRFQALLRSWLSEESRKAKDAEPVG